MALRGYGVSQQQGRTSVSVISTAASTTFLRVPVGYDFEIRYIRVLNRTGSTKSFGLYTTKNWNGSGDVNYIWETKSLSSKADVELPDISLVLFGNGSTGDTMTITQDGSSTFDLIVSGDLYLTTQQVHLDQ